MQSYLLRYHRRLPHIDIINHSLLSAALSTATKSNAPSIKAVITNNSNALSNPLKFYIETYGCQMNISDSEIVKSVLQSAGHVPAMDIETADLILTNTCAIREHAEAKVWHRLRYFQSIRRKNRIGKGPRFGFPLVGVLGCMAERLKDKLLLEESVDFVCGPDAYRDVPRLVETMLSAGQKQANTMLSFDETYADIHPVREVNTTSAFISIMRGCNNMCSFCVVPFTRGRERSRPMASILQEVQQLSGKGVKELVLLGQNVNGYHDISEESAVRYPAATYESTPGFNNMYRSKKRDLPGARFPDLLKEVSLIDPEMRIRFTSPHPKDFPERTLEVIAESNNICKSLHLPVQSGSSEVLQKMRRGYTREAYLELVGRARDIIPGVSISTDVIAGFCEETEEDHQQTLSLMEKVRFDQAFMFAYSKRDRTHAAHNLEDNVPEKLKLRRLQEIIDTFQREVRQKNDAEELGQLRLVLIEGPSTKSTTTQPSFTGRTDTNKRVVFPATSAWKVNSSTPSKSDAIKKRIVEVALQDPRTMSEEMKNTLIAQGLLLDSDVIGEEYNPPEDMTGEYGIVKILKADSSTLRGVLCGTTSLSDFKQVNFTSL